MIDKRELLDYAQKIGLESRIIEKDYALSWLLAGIYQHPKLKNIWVFKGGTCLKKCYFETYRFSEDLDFTLMDAEQIDETFLKGVFREVAEWIRQQSGMTVPRDEISFDVHPEAEKKYVLGKIGYIGPQQSGGSPAKIKLDLTSNEIVVLKPVFREVYHPYSDKPDGGIHARCYTYEEIFAEKVRALVERLRPRDLYDVIHLYRHKDEQTKMSVILSTLDKKCRFKGIPTPNYGTLNSHSGRGELASEWENMLQHQLPNLPPMESFWGELPEFFNWLTAGAVVKPKLLPAPIKVGEKPYILLRAATIGAFNGPVERIRMAAANRICVLLTYHDKSRVVEPYSFRTSNKGNFLFYGYERDAGHIKAYMVSDIQNVELTDTHYLPKYFIEIN